MNSSGSTANSKEFGSREQAIENQYALQKEAEQLKALKEKLDAASKKEEDNKSASK